MSRRQLLEQMDAREVMKWMAYEMSVDPEKNKEYLKEIEIERQKAQTLEEEAEAVRQFLMSFSG